MKKEFIAKVIREGIVDTEKYRYTAHLVNGPEEQYTEIRRLPLADLDTTAALEPWEVVWTDRTDD